MEPDGFVSWLNQCFATVILALYQFYLLCTCCFLLCSSNATCLFTHFFFFLILQGMRGIEWGATSLSTSDRRETLMREYESTFYQTAVSHGTVLTQFTGMLRPACTTVSEKDIWFVGLYWCWAGIFCKQLGASYKVCKIGHNRSSLFSVCTF